MQVLSELTINENNIAFNHALGTSYQLNPIAKEIITMLQTGSSKDEILKDLSSRYDVDEKDLFIDLGDFISKVKIYGLFG